MSDKLYKCPYCDARLARWAVGNHIELKHEELVPKGMTANQVGFNYVNKKTETYGCCVVCKRPTKWNEKNCKYDRLCGRPECREALREKYKKNMIKVHGKYNLLNDPERQEKMLANRKISNTYRFADGGRHVYTGTYERKALEFLDKVMGFHSRDILSPGPILEYEYKGQKLKWITDIVLIPFNLIIEVKDGGANPNKRQMPTYREKQIAKETMITNLGKYNYLRLTDNNFEQLLDIIAELKMQMVDDTEENRKVLIRVHEEVDMINEATFIDDAYSDEEISIAEADGAILSPTEFKEARAFIKKACEKTDGFKWKFHNSKFNKAGRVARIDYTIPEDIGGGMESNWCDLDEFLREYVFPEIRRNKNRKFIFRSVNDSEDCIDIYAMLKSNPTYPTVPIGKGEIEDANNPNEKSFKYPKTDLDIESFDKDMRKYMQESQQYLDSFHEAVASKYTRPYKNLDEFCKVITSPSEVNDWYFVNKVRWTNAKESAKRYKERHGEDNDDCFIVWPDELLQTKVGICYDHAIFMHYCCERFGIKNAILCIVAMVQFPFKKELVMLGHAVTIYELPKIGWYLFNYQTNLGSILGPYESLEKTVQEYKSWYTNFIIKIPMNFGHKTFNLKPSIHSVHVQVQDKKEQFVVYDQMYNDKYCSQQDLIRRVPGMYEFFGKIPSERTYWIEDFIEKFNLIKKIKSFFESTDLINEEVVMKDKDEKILAKIRKNREFKKFTSKMNDEDKKKIESKMLTKSKGFLSKYASTFKKNHVTEKIMLSTIVGLSLASLGVVIAPVTMAGISFASDNIVDTIKKEETIIKESFGTVIMNLVHAGTNHHPEWFKPSTKFANMIIRETTKFLSKENGDFIHLSFYDPKDPSKEALEAAYYLGQYVQHLDTEENYWDSKKEQLTTTTGLFNIWIDKSDLNFTYMIIFNDDDIKKILYVCYDAKGDRVALVPMTIPPLKTYRDEINMTSHKAIATNSKIHYNQMDFILNLKGKKINLPSNSI